MNKEDLLKYIQDKAVKALYPDGTDYQRLSVKQVGYLEKTLAVSAKNIEITALENGIIPERYVRNFNAFSDKDQIKLLQSKVAVVGLGGLGGSVTEILARIGIGMLILIDGDVFEDSNLNRQMLSSQNCIGTSKAVAAAERVKEINSSVTIIAHQQFLDEQNALNFLSQAHVIVDCLDNIPTRFLVHEAAKKLKKPLVSSAVAGASGQVTTIFPEDKGLFLIYGEPDKFSPVGVEKYLGCLPHAVTFLSAIECSEVVKILLNRGSVLQNQLLLVDLNSNMFEIMNLVLET
jgi:molybdopterin-synthase adenylyltransferase